MHDNSQPNIGEHIASYIDRLASDGCRKLTGIAIGVLWDGHEVSALRGWADSESRRPVTKSTVFEVGSLSKLFTSLLLASAVQRQECELDAPVQDAFGDEVTLPSDGAASITYRSLANHRSSLPRLPGDLLATADMENPYAHYTREMLYECLNGMTHIRSIGSRAEYSNFGVGLLGHALGKLAGTDYHQAVRQRVLEPLGMSNTTTRSDHQHGPELATAYRSLNKPCPHWDFTEAVVAAGGVRSSLEDMFKFLRAHLDPTTSPLAAEILMMQEPSDLPASKRSHSRWLGWALPIGYILILAVFVTCLSGWEWVTAFGSNSLLNFTLILVPTLLGTIWIGRVAGGMTLAAVTLLSWWVWGIEPMAMGPYLLWAVIAISLFTHWQPHILTDYQRGQGRLAWQNWSMRNHLLLWHNGMVGGSASYLGIVPELQIGVVVMANTARSVDGIGDKIVAELIKLKNQKVK